MTGRLGPCTPWTTEPRVLALPALCKLAEQTPPIVPAPDVVERMIEAASWLLWDASGRQWPGTCTDTVLLCARCCGLWHPHRRPCAGSTGPSVVLPFAPVLTVTQVDELLDPPSLDEADVELIDAASYTVEDSRHLIRLGGETWPGCLRITFTHGGAPPELGMHAATVLAAELLAAVLPGAVCRLPQRAQTITRQNVTVGFTDKQAFFADGLTGVYEVDLFLSRFPRVASVQRSRVLSPDTHRPAHRRG